MPTGTPIMADKIVIDASAILAVLLDEPGQENVVPILAQGCCSAIGMAEVASKLTDNGNDRVAVAKAINALALSIYPVEADDAIDIGILRAATRKTGLSLGDRCCLALAKKLGLPVLTADRAWAGIADAVGVEVRVIR